MRGAGCVRKRWQLPSTPGVILPQATAARATYTSEPVFSVHRTARHTLVKQVPTREVATNKLLFFTALATVTAAQPSNLYVKIKH